MARGNGFVPGQSLPATVPPRNNLFPGQGVTLDGNRSPAEGAVALQRDAWTNIEAEAKAQVAEAEAEAKARAAEAEALEAEAKAQVAVAEAEAKARAAEAEAAIKIRVAEAEMRKADLKIVKLRKELEVLTGESEVQEYLLSLSLRPSLCLSLTACFSDLNSLGSPYSVFASVFLSFLSDRRAAGQRR